MPSMADAPDDSARWLALRQPGKPTATQAAVLDYLERRGETLSESGGRPWFSGGWFNPRYFADGTPRCTAGTFGALKSQHWVEPQAGQPLVAEESDGSVVRVDFRRGQAAAADLAKHLFQWSQMASLDQIAGSPRGVVVAFVGEGEPNIAHIGLSQRDMLAAARAIAGRGVLSDSAVQWGISLRGRYALLCWRQRLQAMPVGVQGCEAQKARREERERFLQEAGCPWADSVARWA